MKEPIVIPGINEPTFEEVKNKIKDAQDICGLIHIDITDGIFVNHKTFSEIDELYKLETPTYLEVHLMVNSPEKFIPESPNTVKKIITHVESTTFSREFLEDLREKGFLVCVALKLDTDWENVEPFMELIDCVLFMSVPLGPKGQQFSTEVLSKIRSFRKKFPDMPIEVDGGINPDTIKVVKDAGADYFVSVSYPFKDGMIEDNILELEELIDYDN